MGLGALGEVRIGAKELFPIKGTGYGKKPWYVQVKDYFQFLQTIEEHTSTIQGGLNSLVSLNNFLASNLLNVSGASNGWNWYYGVDIGGFGHSIAWNSSTNTVY